MDYRREIDGLRALAVLPVVLFHAGFQIFSGGFVGVDVFFVISGYLITTIILGELEQGKFSIVNFYERRARRILPVLFAVIFICLPFSWVWLIPTEMKSFSQSLVAVSIFSSNILFWLTSGYFSTAAELKPLLHTWSLAVEEQYYLFFPIFLMMAWKIGKRSIFAILVISFLASLLFAQWASLSFPTMAFFLLPTRGWELLIGAFVAFYFNHYGFKQLPRGVKEFGGTAGLILIIYSIFYFDKNVPFPSFYTLLPTVGTALIILCATRGTVVARILGNKLFVGLGLLSYSIYLWHQPLLAFARQKSFDEPAESVMISIVLLTLLLSYFSWKFIETPFRNKSRYSKRIIFIFALIGTLVFTGFGLAGHVTNGFPDREAALPFKPFEFDMDKLGYRKCPEREIMGNESINYCYQGRKGNVNAVLIGDSHAADKFYGIERNVKGLNWALVGNSSCPPLLDVNVEWDQKMCLEKFEKIIPWVKNSREISTVVLSFFGNYELISAYAADNLIKNISTMHGKNDGIQKGMSRHDLFYFGLSQSVRELLADGRKVIVLVDIPELPFFPVDCVKGKSSCTIPLKEVLERQSMHRQSLQRLKREFPSVNIYDPLNIFCSEKFCSYRTAEKILYRDSHHLTLDGSDTYGNKFALWLATLPE
ncbi:acyltransferase family protein [Janthinobacterium sp. DSP2-3-3]|uniref:acyltransferase family protein n=1 Tax=Janthinobacterium sp. DSP2-3-3 TaxID=2804596 RepID=UPI003CE79E7C